jgi:hypothetical protein
MSSAEQVVLAAAIVPLVVQAGPVNVLAWKTVPYTLSQIWSTMMSPKFDELVIPTV